MKKTFILLASAFSLLTAKAQIPETTIDSLVNATMKTFEVPGIAVAVVKDGKVVMAKGYGVRSLANNLPVDENTLFGIASNSKAFTSAALGMLVDEKKIKWDDKVTDYIPEFKMYDAYVTAEFTIRDLLTHRSGLGLGSGDLMFCPDGGNFTKTEMIHNIRYLKAVSGFRTKYDYDNNLYMVAGEVIARVSGMSWEEFIEQKIMAPLGFASSKASYNRVKNNPNIIDAHAPADGKVIMIPHDWNDNMNAAGGIMSNLTDLSKWVIMQMNDGKYGDGKQLFSKGVHDEMWSMQTIIGTSPGGGTYNTHFSSYGLGWFLSDVKGYKQVTHTGGLLGTVTQVTLIPELKLGIIVLTNQQQGVAFSTITNTIKDSYLGYPDRHWLATYTPRWKAANDDAKKILDKTNADIAAQQKMNIKPVDSLFTGTYRDQWFGDIIISKKDGGLWFASVKSPRLSGALLPYKGNTMVAKWTDRSMDADAYVMFTLDKDGKANGFKMEAISPLTDFSFDFQDLDVKRKYER